MTTWYVRPDISHSGTRNGASYATAWGGWPEIVWGGVGVVGGDTLYVCGAHAFAAITGIGNHGATVNSRVAIRGDYALSPGSMKIAAGPFYFNINRSYTTLKNLTITAGTGSCIVITGAPSTGVTIQGCTFYGTAASMIVFLVVDTWSYINTIIDSNKFLNNAGGGGGAAIQWYAQAAITSIVTNLQITNNTFSNCSAARAVILLKALNAVLPGTKMGDIVVTNNTFQDCGAVMMEIYGPEVVDRNTGIQIHGNRITNQLLVGGIGGAIVVGGFGQSTNASFGPNLIYDNRAYGLAGPSGFINPFYGRYIIFNNYAENISTQSIDGCGILFDHGCHDTIAFGNEFHNITGTGLPDYTSGFGILVLDATNCVAFGNIFDGCVMGIGYGNKASGQSSNIYNNTFLKCSLSGVNGNGSAALTNNLVRNNILTATSAAVQSVRFLAGTLAGESNNCFHGFGKSTQALHATDLIANPLLDNNYKPQAALLKRVGTYLGGTDFNGKQFYNPPNIGAVDDVTSTPRHLLTGG